MSTFVKANFVKSHDNELTAIVCEVVVIMKMMVMMMMTIMVMLMETSRTLLTMGLATRLYTSTLGNKIWL